MTDQEREITERYARRFLEMRDEHRRTMAGLDRAHLWRMVIVVLVAAGALLLPVLVAALLGGSQ